MLKATYFKYQLEFIDPGITSRGVMNVRTSWFLIVRNMDIPSIAGIGECAPLPGLSRDGFDDIEKKLEWACNNINSQDILTQPDLWDFPSILFALESALLDINHGGKRLIFDNSFYQKQAGIPINGLIWMGSIDYMLQSVKRKINEGFNCIKLKISSKNIDEELIMIRQVRNLYGWDIEIRVDANGAFDSNTIIPVLKQLADLNVHSIEQPLPSMQYNYLAKLCKNTPVPVALDEDIVHWPYRDKKIQLLETIKPQYIVLKPGLIGGFTETKEWIELAGISGIGWWITSALESNIGLNAIAQFTNQWKSNIPHGLGTGKVFSNNLHSPLYVENGNLFYNQLIDWNLSNITL